MSRDKEPISEQRLEQFLEEIFSPLGLNGQSDDQTFLRDFYDKLRRGAYREPLSFGGWCWKLAPLTGVLSIVLCSVFFFDQPSNAAVPQIEEPVFSLLSDNVGEDVLVEAFLHRRGGD